MKTYYITYVVDGRLTIKIDAENEEQAYEKAEQEFEIADLNEMEIVSAYARE